MPKNQKIADDIKAHSKSNMYKNTKTWNPFKGCRFDCTYCKPTFKKQAKRQKRRCMDCYSFVPHYHPERLTKIPSSDIVFVCGNADISFCDPDYTRQIVEAIKQHNRRCPHKIYYFQSKRPEYFGQFLTDFPGNVILVTTLETNRDDGYQLVSKAPVPSERFKQFMNLEYSRKVVTIEPLLDFDVKVFVERILLIKPEYVWIGFNSRPNQVSLPEPSNKKVLAFIRNLRMAGTEVRGKTMRGIELCKEVSNEI